MINQYQRLSYIRLAALGLLFVAALMVAVALHPGAGIAAPDGQTSPLATATAAGASDSPIQTPTATPSPTPTATSPLPPTAEPPATLLGWPTPTPTPFPLAIQSAIDTLTSDESLGVTSATFSAQLLVDDPATGDELTVVRLDDPAVGASYWLQSNSEGESVRLPDFAEYALTLVAESKSVDVTDLQFAYGFYIPFPFTRQIFWIGQIKNTQSGAEYSLALNLAGEEIDQEGVSAAEAAAIEEFCGAIDVSLCVEMLNAPEDALFDVVLVPVEESDPQPIVAYLEESETPFRQEEEEFYFRMESGVLRELAQLEEIDQIVKDYPDELRPLDTNLLIGLIEESGALSLTLESQELYPLLTYRVEATLERVEITQTQSVTLLAQIDGIFAPTKGPSSLSPAQARLPLGKLSGRYNLALAYSDPARELELLDSYILIVSDGRAVVRPNETTFTWAKYPTWLRLPANAIWFVAQARSTDAAGKPFDLNGEIVAEKTAAFYGDIAALRARELSLSEGIYTNALFVPPWPTWQIPDGDFVQVPVSESQSYLFRWPDIRYFTYTGQLRAVEALIAEHCVDELAIVGYTANGDVLDVCQP